jgi:hypothetical protein
MKAIKKACSGTSLYPKLSSVSSKLKTGGKIKKAQNGIVKYSDPTPLFEKLQKTRDSLNVASKKLKAKRVSEDSAWKAKWDQAKSKLPKKKNGGTVKAKDGKWMQKAAASIKKRGTAGKCTPISKKSCTGKAKTLALTFKKIAAKRKSK